MRMLRGGRLGALAASLALVLALAPAAAAQDDDPQVDPDSPAGTEYELPIDQGARAGRSRIHRRVGSGRRVRRATAVRRGRRSPAAGRRALELGLDSSTTPEAGRSLGDSTPEVVRSQAGSPGGGGVGLLTIGAGAAGVLLIGGAAGLLWRRRSVRG